jgi:hypothetical protein
MIQLITHSFMHSPTHSLLLPHSFFTPHSPTHSIPHSIHSFTHSSLPNPPLIQSPTKSTPSLILHSPTPLPHSFNPPLNPHLHSFFTPPFTHRSLAPPLTNSPTHSHLHSITTTPLIHSPPHSFTERACGSTGGGALKNLRKHSGTERKKHLEHAVKKKKDKKDGYLLLKQDLLPPADILLGDDFDPYPSPPQSLQNTNRLLSWRKYSRRFVLRVFYYLICALLRLLFFFCFALVYFRFS